MMPEHIAYANTIPGKATFRGVHASDEATALRFGLQKFKQLYGTEPARVFWSEKNKTLLMEVPNERQNETKENTPSLEPEQDASGS